MTPENFFEGKTLAMDPSPESCHMRIFQLYRESAGLVLAIDIVAKCEDIINFGQKILIWRQL